MQIDWDQHRSAWCVFTPREAFQGRELLPSSIPYIGTTVKLVALWKMDEADPYPGEWALGAVDRGSDVFGRVWVASGEASRAELDDLLLAKLPEVLEAAQKRHKVRNLIQSLRRRGHIRNVGSRGAPVWELGEAPLIAKPET